MREMKDSGIEWIGEIPRNWEVSRIKYVCNNRSEKAQFDHEEDSYLGLENVVGFSDKIIETDTTYIDGYYDIYKSGDVLFNKLRPYLGKVIIAPYDGFCTGEFIRLYNYQGDNRFLRYWMIDEQFITEVDNSTYGAKMPRANPDFILNMPIAIVSSDEQHRISAFLDSKCSEIDALTEDIQSQIDTLEQYKRSVITEAVTKGLDPDVEMKDSRIEWIGEIPQKWLIKKVKNAASYIGSGTTPTSGKAEFYEDGDIHWIQSGDLYGKEKINGVSTDVTEYAVKLFSALHIYKAPYIVIAMYGGSVGNIAISNIDACVNQACCCIQPDSSNDLKYMYYWLFSCRSDFLRVTDGGGQPNISQTKIKNQYYVQPPLSEQHRISAFLDAKCSDIDETISLKKQQLETLEKLKKSIIYEYVTGKKEVPA